MKRRAIKKRIRYAVVSMTFVCVLTPSYAVYAEAAPEGQIGSAFGSDSTESDSYTIISDYSGSSSAESSISNSTSDELPENQISLGDSVYYDEETKQYLYDTEIGRVESNVMDGMIVSEPVTLTSDNSAALILYKDGERMAQKDVSSFSDNGYYVVQYNDNDGVTRTIMDFMIVGEKTGLIDSYDLPSGFSVTEATRDGASISTSSTIDMTKEGEYHIAYQCDRTKVSYTLNVGIDHTAPVLALEAVKNGVAKGPVDISDVEEGATVAITFDGKNYNYREKLSQSGNYEITVTDDAGNETSYAFTIRIYLDSSAYISIVIVLAILVGIGGYMLFERKKLRTR